MSNKPETQGVLPIQRGLVKGIPWDTRRKPLELKEREPKKAITFAFNTLKQLSLPY